VQSNKQLSPDDIPVVQSISRDHSFLWQIFPNSVGQFAKFRGSLRQIQIFHT